MQLRLRATSKLLAGASSCALLKTAEFNLHDF